MRVAAREIAHATPSSSHSRAGWYLAVLVGVAVFAAGCADNFGELAGSTVSARLETATFVSDHYDMKVVGHGLGKKGPELARHSALMMEKVFEVYSGMEEIPLPPGGTMPFWLHLDRAEYDRQAALYDFPARATNGFCTTSGEVHVYFKRSGKTAPEATAMHEGFHQYCYRALHYPTPPEVFARVPNYRVEKLPTVPLWLNEGMAMNMESGRIDRDHNGITIAIDDVGAVNVDRLEHLVRLINSNRCPSVRHILNLIMGDQISVDDYAAMWGIVFDLRIATGNAIFEREQREVERLGPDAVRFAIDAAIDPHRPYPHLQWPVPVAGRLLRACRVVWGLNVPELVDTCAVNAREPRDFDRQWNRRLTQAALAEVEKLFVDQGETIEQWEAGWKKRMIALQAEVKAGRYHYEEPAGIDRARNRYGRQAIGAW